MAGIDISTIGGSAFSLGLQLGLALIGIIVIAALFFGTRWAIGAWRNWKNYKITAIVFNRDGTFYIKKIGKFRTVDNIDKMKFRASKETMPVIGTENIRQNKVVLWRYAPGQYAVIPPRIWEKLTPEHFKIEVIDYQMKNFAYLEQRAAISRWSFIKDALAKWAPFITILILAIAGGVVVYFIMKLALVYYTQVTAARIMDCKQALGTAVNIPSG